MPSFALIFCSMSFASVPRSLMRSCGVLLALAQLARPSLSVPGTELSTVMLDAKSDAAAFAPVPCIDDVELPLVEDPVFFLTTLTRSFPDRVDFHLLTFFGTTIKRTDASELSAFRGRSHLRSRRSHPSRAPRS